jgi:hypothetical protein
MLDRRVLTKRTQIETYSEATHEKAGWDDLPSFLFSAGDAGLRDSKRGRALLRVWVPVGRGIDAAECDERGKRAGGGVKYGERKGAGREAARICGIRKEPVAVTSRGSGTGDECADGSCDGEREVSLRFFVVKRSRVFLPVFEC